MPIHAHHLPASSKLIVATALLLGSVDALARSAEIACDNAPARTPTTVSLAAPVNGDFNPVGGGQLAWIDVLWLADTDRTGRWFDVGFSGESVFSTGQTSDRMLDMIEGATGSTPPAYLGGSLVLEATSLRDVEPVRFISPQDGFVSGDTFTVTGPNPSVLASHWVTSVQFEGREQLTPDGLLRNLSPAESPLVVILGEEQGAERFLLHVVDGRIDLQHEPFSCPGQPGTGVIAGLARGNPGETGLRYIRGLEQGFAPIEAGRFEMTGLNCPPNTDQTLVTARGTLGDQVFLAIDARPGDGSVCNARELLTRDRVLQAIEVWVTPAL